MDKDEWPKIVSPTCPGPRSARAVVAASAGGGKLFLFGTISQALSVRVRNPLHSALSCYAAGWRVFVPIPEQPPSLQRLLVFRRIVSVVGSYRYQGWANCSVRTQVCCLHGRCTLFSDCRLVGWPCGNTTLSCSVASMIQDIPVRSYDSVSSV